MPMKMRPVFLLEKNCCLFLLDKNFIYIKKYLYFFFKKMDAELRYYYLTFQDYRDFCVCLTCKGHKPPLKINCEKDGTIFYSLNRHQLNEFCNCCLNDQKTFCSLICPDSCKVCKFVKAVHGELTQNFFFDFDTRKSVEQQPYLWRFFSTYLDKKCTPVLAEIQIVN